MIHLNIPYHTWTQCLFVPVSSQPIFFMNVYDPCSFVSAAEAVAKKGWTAIQTLASGMSVQCSTSNQLSYQANWELVIMWVDDTLVGDWCPSTVYTWY